MSGVRTVDRGHDGRSDVIRFEVDPDAWELVRAVLHGRGLLCGGRPGRAVQPGPTRAGGRPPLVDRPGRARPLGAGGRRTPARPGDDLPRGRARAPGAQLQADRVARRDDPHGGRRPSAVAARGSRPDRGVDLRVPAGRDRGRSSTVRARHAPARWPRGGAPRSPATHRGRGHDRCRPVHRPARYSIRAAAPAPSWPRQRRPVGPCWPAATSIPPPSPVPPRTCRRRRYGKGTPGGWRSRTARSARSSRTSLLDRGSAYPDRCRRGCARCSPS